MKQKAILKAFRQGRKLTVLHAVNKYKTVELRKIVSILRRDGIKIRDEWAVNKKTKTRYKVYYL